MSSGGCANRVGNPLPRMEINLPKSEEKWLLRVGSYHFGRYTSATQEME